MVIDSNKHYIVYRSDQCVSDPLTQCLVLGQFQWSETVFNFIIKSINYNLYSEELSSLIAIFMTCNIFLMKLSHGVFSILAVDIGKCWKYRCLYLYLDVCVLLYVWGSLIYAHIHAPVSSYTCASVWKLIIFFSEYLDF